MINSRASGNFSFDANNHLVHSSDSSGQGGQSSYYESRLVEGIESSKIITLDIPASEGGRQGTDRVFGGGVTDPTGKNIAVSISGNSNDRLHDTNGGPLRNTPADIL